MSMRVRVQSLVPELWRALQPQEGMLQEGFSELQWELRWYINDRNFRTCAEEFQAAKQHSYSLTIVHDKAFAPTNLN
jgi:hypothetical protein